MSTDLELFAAYEDAAESAERTRLAQECHQRALAYCELAEVTS